MVGLKLRTAKYDYTTSRRIGVVKRVIAFVCELSATDAVPLHTKKLREVFGKESNDFAKHLKALCLVKVSGQYIVGKQSQSYVRNEEGVQRLIDAVGLKQEDVGALLIDQYAEYQSEIESGSFKYNEKDNRFYHAFQNIKKTNKQSFWASHGYHHDLDIESSAATLLYQAAVKARCPAVLLGDLRAYVDDKVSVRQYYVDLLKCDAVTAKEVVTAMINLAHLGFKHCSLNRVLTRAQIEVLADDKYTIGLRATLKLMWNFLGRAHRFKPTGANRWKLYRAIERQVMDVVVEQCAGRVFREHDGLRTDTPVDIRTVAEVVKQRTGFDIKLAYNHHPK